MTDAAQTWVSEGWGAVEAEFDGFMQSMGLGGDEPEPQAEQAAEQSEAAPAKDGTGILDIEFSPLTGGSVSLTPEAQKVLLIGGAALLLMWAMK